MVSKTYRFRKPVRVTRTHSSVTYGSSGGGGGGPSPKQPTVRVSSNVKKIGKTAEGKDLYGIDPNAGKVNYYYNPETGQKSYQVGSKVVPSGAIPITQQQFKSPEKLEVKTIQPETRTISPRSERIKQILQRQGKVVSVDDKGAITSSELGSDRKVTITSGGIVIRTPQSAIVSSDFTESYIKQRERFQRGKQDKINKQITKVVEEKDKKKLSIKKVGETIKTKYQDVKSSNKITGDTLNAVEDTLKLGKYVFYDAPSQFIGFVARKPAQLTTSFLDRLDRTYDYVVEKIPEGDNPQLQKLSLKSQLRLYDVPLEVLKGFTGRISKEPKKLYGEVILGAGMRDFFTSKAVIRKIAKISSTAAGRWAIQLTEGILLGSYGASIAIDTISEPKGKRSEAFGRAIQPGAVVVGTAYSPEIGTFIKKKIPKIKLSVEKTKKTIRTNLGEPGLEIKAGFGKGKYFKGYDFRSHNGAIKIQVVKFYNRPLKVKPYKTYETTVYPEVLIDYPKPVTLKISPLNEKTYPRWHSQKSLGYDPTIGYKFKSNKELNLNSFSIIESYGYTAAIRSKIVADLVRNIKLNIKHPKVSKPIMSRLTSSKPKPPKGYQFIEREIKDSLGRIQVQLQLTKVKTIQKQKVELKLKQVKRQRTKFKIIQKQVSVQRQVQSQKSKLLSFQKFTLLSKLMNRQDSKLALALGVAQTQRQAQKQAQLQKQLQTQIMGQVSIQNTVQSQNQIKSQRKSELAGLISLQLQKSTTKQKTIQKQLLKEYTKPILPELQKVTKSPSKRRKRRKFSEGEVFIPGFTSRALNFKVKTTRHKLFKQIKQKTFTGFEFRKIPVLA